MPTITIEKPFGGWIPDYTASNGASVEGGNLQYARSDGVDLFRQGFVGHLTPAQVFNDGAITDGSANINSLVRNLAVDVGNATPRLYAILGGLSGTAPRVVRVISNSYDSHQVITAHAGNNFTTLGTDIFWGEDIVIYRANNSGTPGNFTFYSWQDNANGDIGRVQVQDSAIYDDDFMSTLPAGTAFLNANVPHRMIEGMDRILYITNRDYLASYNGSSGNNGTFNNQALNLGANWIGVDARKFRTFVMATAVKIPSTSYSRYSFSSESRVILWDGFSPSYNFEYDVDDYFASASFVVGNDIYVWTRGKNNTTKLKIFDGRSRFLTLFEYPTSVIGTPPYPTSIEYYNDFLVWLPGDGTSSFVCAYGPLSSSIKGFHVIAIANDGTNNSTTSGMLKNIDANRLYAGGLFGSVYRPAFLDGTGGYATSRNWRSRLITHYDDGTPLDPKARITKCTVHFSQSGSGASCVISAFKDYDTMSVGGAADLINKTITNAATLGRRYYSFPVNITDINSLYVNIRWNHSAITDTAFIIRKIVFKAEPTKAI